MSGGLRTQLKKAIEQYLPGALVISLGSGRSAKDRVSASSSDSLVGRNVTDDASRLVKCRRSRRNRISIASTGQTHSRH